MIRPTISYTNGLLDQAKNVTRLIKSMAFIADLDFGAVLGIEEFIKCTIMRLLFLNVSRVFDQIFKYYNFFSLNPPQHAKNVMQLQSFFIECEVQRITN